MSCRTHWGDQRHFVSCLLRCCCARKKSRPDVCGVPSLKCRDIHLTRHFSHAVCTFNCTHAWLKTSSPMCLCSADSFHLLVIHDVCLSVVGLLVFVLLLFLSVLHLFSSTLYLHSVRHSISNSITSKDKTTVLSHNMTVYHPFTGYEPNVLDDLHYSKTSAMIFQDESGDIDTEPSYSCDAKLDDENMEKALSSPLFTLEREEPANRRQAYRSHEESLLPAQSFGRDTRTQEKAKSIPNRRGKN